MYIWYSIRQNIVVSIPAQPQIHSTSTQSGQQWHCCVFDSKAECSWYDTSLCCSPRQGRDSSEVRVSCCQRAGLPSKLPDGHNIGHNEDTTMDTTTDGSDRHDHDHGNGHQVHTDPVVVLFPWYVSDPLLQLGPSLLPSPPFALSPAPPPCPAVTKIAQLIGLMMYLLLSHCAHDILYTAVTRRTPWSTNISSSRSGSDYTLPRCAGC